MAEAMEKAEVGSVNGSSAPRRPDPVVVREFAAIGKYRVRVVKSSAGPRASTVLDVREYAKSDTFEGFTRRGIRISSLADAKSLMDALREIVDGGLLK